VVPNALLLGAEHGRLWLITGPNLSVKSTFIRQVALLTLMAQMGSFVPARRARIGIADRIFTRVGANDELSRGQSTFMVEMTEAANILNNATPKSLVILDEIGRATKSYGIHVARLAGVPGEVLERAQQVLGELEGRSLAGNGQRPARAAGRQKGPARQAS